jgi:hypothetical protein
MASARWMYRVVCAEGAFVREGLDLSSKKLREIPMGSTVEVTARVVNNAGLVRLRVTDGWISEAHNPTSGTVRGPEGRGGYFVLALSRWVV